MPAHSRNGAKYVTAKIDSDFTGRSQQLYCVFLNSRNLERTGIISARQQMKTVQIYRSTGLNLFSIQTKQRRDRETIQKGKTLSQQCCFKVDQAFTSKWRLKCSKAAIVCLLWHEGINTEDVVLWSDSSAGYDSSYVCRPLGVLVVVMDGSHILSDCKKICRP